MTVTMPTAKDAADALRLAKAFEKACKLEAEGYTFAYGVNPNIIRVTKEGDIDPSYYTLYVEGACDCPANKANGRRYCKHSLAAAMWHNRNEAAYAR